MAVSACCRAVSASSSSEDAKPNRAFARSSHLSCNDVCAGTEFKGCDAELSIGGSHKKATSSKDELGWYVNHGCENKAEQAFEPSSHDDQVMKDGSVMSFCCCAVPDDDDE